MLRAGTQSYNDRKKCNVEDQPGATQNLVVGITDTTGSPLLPLPGQAGVIHAGGEGGEVNHAGQAVSVV